jgi:TonB family protein
MAVSLLASLFLNAVVAAAPVTPLPWYRFDDYPQKAFDREWRGVATIAVLVDPSGRPAECTIVQSTGHGLLDRQTCFVAMKRVRFTPAHGPDGNPAYGLYRSQVTWTRPDQDAIQRDPGPDIELTANELPAGTQQPAAVKLAYFVDSTGAPSACTPLPDSLKQPDALVRAACEQLFSRLPRTPATARGAAVAVVKTAAVKFSAGQ